MQLTAFLCYTLNKTKFYLCKIWFYYYSGSSNISPIVAAGVTAVVVIVVRAVMDCSWLQVYSVSKSSFEMCGGERQQSDAFFLPR